MITLFAAVALLSSMGWIAWRLLRGGKDGV